MAKKYYSYNETHQMVRGVKLKRCVKCKAWKEYSEFRNDRARRDGLRIYCKTCDKATERKRRRKNRKAVRQYLSYEDRHRIVRGFKEKLCCCCQQWKYESCFHKNRRTNDGLSYQCKECSKRDSRKRLEQSKEDPRRNLRYEECHRVIDGIKQKLCRKCGKWKTESEYYRNGSARDGLNSRCKKCAYKSVRKSCKK